MFEVWIPVTIAAAFFQNVRSAIQKHLTGVLSGQGAAYSRFLFALPWSALYLLLVLKFSGETLPALSARFLLLCLLGSLSQILATVFLLRSFKFRSFAVGTTISKLEIIIVAALGWLLLGDNLSLPGKIAIALSVIGLIALSIGQNKLSLGGILEGLSHRSTLLGLGAAVTLGGSVVFFRGASLSLGLDNVLLSAAFTLTCALFIQTILFGTYLAIAERGEITRVISSWRWSSLVGVSGMLASVGWFTAFTLQNASYVRALGQIELLFTFIVTTRVFREKVSALELLGCALILCAILLLVLSH